MIFVYHGTSKFLFKNPQNKNGESTILWVTGERSFAEQYARQSANDTNSKPIVLKFRLSDIIDKVKITFKSTYNEILIFEGNIDSIKSLAVHLHL